MNFNPSYGSLLIVEDDFSIWLMLKPILPQALPDVKVVHAIDASAAMSYLQNCSTKNQTSPQLIVQNLYLPERADGLDLLKGLKQGNSAYKQLPVIVMSSSKNQDDINEVYRLGASSYLVKPTGVDEWIMSLHGLQRYWEHTKLWPSVY
jgi:response regulator of citrate/malate metabolism